jgi:hypothetical protein
MEVWWTPDRRWRIQATGQRIEVYERIGASLAARPEVVLLSPPDLVAWLAERRLGLADLIED